MKFETLKNHSSSTCGVVFAPSPDRLPAEEVQKVLLLLEFTEGD